MRAFHLPYLKGTEASSAPRPAPHEPLPSPVAKVILEAWDAYDWGNSSNAITEWFNGRWKKSGFQVSKETICFTLRSQGRDARMGLGDRLDGAFYREMDQLGSR